MNKKLTSAIVLVGLLLVCLIASSNIAVAQTAADSVNVTFLVNTSTVPDTMRPTSFVQIRGDRPLLGPWSKDSKAILTNAGGDYWVGTFKFKKGDSFPYKFFTNHNPSLTPEIQDNGWEQNLTDPSGNRLLTVGQRDTVLPLQYEIGRAHV